MSLGRAVVGLFVLTAGLAAVAALTPTYAVAVVATLLAGLTSLAAVAGAVFYALTAMWAHDRELARHRRVVIGRWLWLGVAALVALFVWAVLNALGNAA